MSALPLFDFILSSAGTGPSGTGRPTAVDRLARLAERLIASALEELRGIREFDVCLAPASPAEFDRQAAMLLRGMYEQWVRDADAVLDRVGRVTRLGRKVAGADDIRNEQGRVLAMLGTTIDELEESRRLFRTGRTYSAEEVRRELRAGA